MFDNLDHELFALIFELKSSCGYGTSSANISYNVERLESLLLTPAAEYLFQRKQQHFSSCCILN